MKEGQVYRLKEGQEQPGLPQEITITKVDGDAVFITSLDGDWESSKEVIHTFYEAKEEFTAENMPKLSVEAIDECVSLIEIFVTTQNALAGLQAKTKLVALKENISKLAGLKTAMPVTLLGKKVL